MPFFINWVRWIRTIASRDQNPLPYRLAITQWMEGSGFEPPNPKERIYSPPRLARLRYPSDTSSLDSNHITEKQYQFQVVYLENFQKIKKTDQSKTDLLIKFKAVTNNWLPTAVKLFLIELFNLDFVIFYTFNVFGCFFETLLFNTEIILFIKVLIDIDFQKYFLNSLFLLPKYSFTHILKYR